MSSFPFRYYCLAEVTEAVDGDTMKAATLDFGQGVVLKAPGDDPFKLRLVGPEGVWFDAAESRGRKAHPKGKEATRILRDSLERIWTAYPMARIGFETFPNTIGSRDVFGRWLFHPFCYVLDGSVAFKFDPITDLVQAGVAALGNRWSPGG